MSALWMIVAAFMFSVLSVCVKLAAHQYDILEIVFYRSLIGVVIIAAFVAWRGLTLATQHARTHFQRGASGTAALALWFYATTLLPLGTAMTLNYASSLYLAAAVVFVAWRRRQPIDFKLMLTVLIGFIGVLLVLKPSFADDQVMVALAGLLSGLLAAVAYWNVRELAQMGEPEWRTVFYFSLTGTLLGIIGPLLEGFTPHTANGALLLLGVGVSALLAQLAMTRAYGSVHTLLVANLQYSAIVFASILGVVLFQDVVPAIGWIGIIIIVFSGVAATTLTARRRATGPAEVTDVEPTAER